MATANNRLLRPLGLLSCYGNITPGHKAYLRRKERTKRKRAEKQRQSRKS